MKPSTFKKISAGLAVFMVMAMMAVPVYAATDVVTHAVTVSVPDIIDLTADTNAFTLTFSDFISGSNSSTQTVTYTLKANNMTQANGAAVLTASLDAAFTSVTFAGDVGTYSSTGGAVTAGEAAAGYITVGASSTTLATKGGTGRVLRGTLPVTYRATATADLPSGDTTQTLTVTLANA